MSTNKENVLCTLLAARTIIDVDGWTQGGAGMTERGACCAAVAIGIARSSELIDVADSEKLRVGSDIYAAQKALRPFMGKPFADKFIMAWNDAPGRTKAQVLKAFDKAIAKLEREMDSK